MLENQATVVRYVSNGTLLTYPIAFIFFEESNVKFQIQVTETEYKDLELNVDYSVTRFDNGYGELTLFEAVEKDLTVAVYLEVPARQALSLTNAGQIPVGAMEYQLDRNTASIMILQEEMAGALKFPKANESTAMELLSDLYNARDEAQESVNNALEHVNNALEHVNTAKSWAIGSIEERAEGSSKYWSEQSSMYADEAEDHKETARLYAKILGDSVDQIVQNTKDIATNKENIEVNTQDISNLKIAVNTNTNNIAIAQTTANNASTTATQAQTTATQAQTTAGTKWTQVSATTSAEGTVQLATSTEVATGTNATKAITPSTLLGRTGTTARAGVVQLTNSVTSTSTTTAATPASVKQAYDLALTASSSGGSFPSGTYIELSSSLKIYTAPSDGYLHAYRSSVSSGIVYRASCDDGYAVSVYGHSGAEEVDLLLPMKAGSTASTTLTHKTLHFYPVS